MECSEYSQLALLFSQEVDAAKSGFRVDHQEVERLPDKALGCRRPLQFGRSEHRGKQRRGLHGLRLSAVRPKQKEFHVPKSSGELAKHLGVVKDLLQTQRGELGSRAALLQTHRGVAYAGRGGGGGRGGRGGGAGHQKRHVGFTGTQNECCWVFRLREEGPMALRLLRC